MNKSHFAIYLLFCLLAGVAVWMLSYGLILQFVWKDGRILKLTTTTDPLAPFQQLIAYPSSRPLQLAAAGALLPSILIAAVFLIGSRRRPASPLGDAAFQTLTSLRRDGWLRKDGLILGRVGRNVLRRADDRHHLIIGPTRSGKTIGYVIPNALMFPGSMIVTDLKGEIFQLTAGYRKARGHRIFLFSPGSPKTHRWNPLDFVRIDRGSRTIDIQNIAAILIPETTGSENAVWQATAQQVIAGVISYILESPLYRNRRNLGEVNSFFNAGVDLQVLMRLIKESEPDLSRFTMDSFNAYVSLNERAARSALLDVQKALAPFRNERVTAATAVTDMDLISLQQRPVTIYLAPNITDMTILRPLLTLFVQQVMDLLTREHNANALPVYFLLDEFRQLKKMDEILNKLPYVGGYNVKMAFIIQDLKNLDGIYGETARHSLLGNCGLQLILGANDQATAEYAARALGKRTIRYQSESRTLEPMGIPHRTKIEQIRERDLMMPQEIRQMPEDRMFVLVEGQRPIFGSKLKYYATEPFKSAVEFASVHREEIPEVEFIRAMPLPALVQGRTAAGENNGAVNTNTVETLPTVVTDSPEKVARAIGRNTIAEPLKKQAMQTAAGRNDLDTRLADSARRLQSAVNLSLAQSPNMPVQQRRTIQDVLAHTIPDPDEIGPGEPGHT